MKIFNIEIFGSDAQWFNDLSINEKVEWIKKRTNQQNDDLINEFLSAIIKEDDTNCLTCGIDANISKTNAVESKPIKRKLVKAKSTTDSTKRQR